MSSRGYEILRLVLRRLVALAAVLIVVSVAIFALIHAAPGSPELALLGPTKKSPQVIKAVRQRWGLDDSLPVQYVTWLGRAVRLDLGRSNRSGEDVLSVVASRAAVSLQLALLAIVITVVLGVGFGGLAAYRRGTGLDRLLVGIGVAGISAPAFVTGIILAYLFGVLIPLFPVVGAGSGGMDRLYHLSLPALALALTGIGSLLKLTRASVSDTLEQDHVEFARARGLPRRRMASQYVGRNSAISVIAASGAVFAVLLGAAVLVEVTFQLPGIGAGLVQAVDDLDIPLIQGIAMVFAVVIMLVNLLLDVLYLLVDPRVTYEQSAA